MTFSEPVTVAGRRGSRSPARPVGRPRATVSRRPHDVHARPRRRLRRRRDVHASPSTAAAVTDQDAIDPPDAMAAEHVFAPHDGRGATVPTADVVISEVYGGGGNAGATLHERLHRALQPHRHARSASPAGRCSTRPPRADLAGHAAHRIDPGRPQLPVQEAAAPAARRPCPTPDATGSIAMSRARPARSPSSRARRRSPAPARRREHRRLRRLRHAPRTASRQRPTPVLSNTTSALRKGGGTGHGRQLRRLRRRRAGPAFAARSRRPPCSRRRPRTARPASRATRTSTDHVQRARERQRPLVHDRLRDERRAPGARASGGPTTLHARPRHRTSRPASRARSPSRRPNVSDQDADRPAGHDGREPRRHLHRPPTSSSAATPATRHPRRPGRRRRDSDRRPDGDDRGRRRRRLPGPRASSAASTSRRRPPTPTPTRCTSEGIFVFSNGFGPT